MKIHADWRDRTPSTPAQRAQDRRDYLNGRAALLAKGRPFTCPGCGHSREPNEMTGGKVPCAVRLPVVNTRRAD